jgi:DNA helicase-2/ATP-dependent DNA helicase PcrA
MDIAQNKAEQAGIEAALEWVKRCIDNYHDSELADWRLVASERYFRLRLDDDPALERPLIVQGYIDAIYRHQSEYYVVDYKTGSRSESHEFQADIYTLACRELWDYDVDEARIFYVEENEQEIIPRNHIKGDTLRDTVRQKLQRLNESGFGNPTPGDHCRYCPHRNLPCSKYSRADSVSND